MSTQANSQTHAQANPSAQDSSNIAHFMTKGYMLFRMDEIRTWHDADTIDAYLQNVLAYQAKIKAFFELDRIGKQRSQALSSDFNYDTKAYFPGWWDEFSYDDRIAHVNYSPEYLMSNNYFDRDTPALFKGSDSEQVGSDKTGHDEIFPNQEGRELCRFFEENVLNRIREELANTASIKLPEISTLQCVMIYYDRDKILSKHTDEVFLSAHIGPTEKGLLIFPPESEEPVSVTLDVGEILIFYGREFKHETDRLGKSPCRILCPTTLKRKRGD